MLTLAEKDCILIPGTIDVANQFCPAYKEKK